MNKELLKQLESKLKEKKQTIQKELEKFAKKDKKIEGDWDTRFPKWNGEVGSAALEKAADEVEEYESLLSIEFTLEKKLRDIQKALDKIRKGEYGLCEKCEKSISPERLKVIPEAKFCKKCRK